MAPALSLERLKSVFPILETYAFPTSPSLQSVLRFGGCFQVWTLPSCNFGDLLEALAPVFPMRTACICYRVNFFFPQYYFKYLKRDTAVLYYQYLVQNKLNIPTECCHSSRKPQVLQAMGTELHQ